MSLSIYDLMYHAEESHQATSAARCLVPAPMPDTSAVDAAASEYRDAERRNDYYLDRLLRVIEGDENLSTDETAKLIIRQLHAGRAAEVALKTWQDMQNAA